MLNIIQLNKLSNYLYTSIDNYKHITNKINNKENLIEDDFFILQLLCKDLCYFNEVDQAFLSELKEINELLNSDWFAQQIDSIQIEDTNKELFDQLVLMKFIIQEKVNDRESILSSLKFLELQVAKLTDIIIKSKHNNCYTPLTIESAITEYFTTEEDNSSDLTS